MYNCLIFDVDGTLLDTEKAAKSSLHMALFETTGVTYKYEELNFTFGIPFDAMVERLNIKDSHSLQKSYLKHIKEKYKKVKCFPDIKEVHESLNEIDLITGIVTSRTSEEIDLDPCLQSIMKYIQYTICANDTVRHKPNPEPLFKFIERSAVEISECIYIGDTYYDFICARKAGIKFALALWGAKDITGITADFNLKEPKDILKIW